jgi:AcrR family transcriptional regulator
MNTNDRALSIRTFVRKLQAMTDELLTTTVTDAAGTADHPDGRRLRGDASRRVILSAAVDLASVEGLDQLSIGRIAQAAGLSKSNVATLFGTKERLQLAAVETARERFIETVIEPARAHPRGLGRAIALVDHWIAYSRDRVFPGGCFFAEAAADFDAKPGEVRDAVAGMLREWGGYLAATLQHAHDAGELPRLDDAKQAAFEFSALLELANRDSLLTGRNSSYRRARAGIASRLRAAGGDPAAIDAFAAVSDG